MSKSDSIEVNGTVIEVLDNGTFRVELSNGHRILVHLSGEMRMSVIRVLPADKVLVELSPFDLSRGRIISRQN